MNDHDVEQLMKDNAGLARALEVDRVGYEKLLVASEKLAADLGAELTRQRDGYEDLLDEANREREENCALRADAVALMREALPYQDEAPHQQTLYDGLKQFIERWK